MASIIIPESIQGLNDMASTDAGSSSVLASDYAIQRRIFIGPMPESVIALTESQPKKTGLFLGSVFSLSQEPDNAGHNGDKSEEVTRVLKDNAYKFFLHQGGDANDWKDGEEQDLIDDLVRRWKESEWGQLWHRRHHRRQADPKAAVSNQWFGTSFEVGNLLGVDITQSQGHLNSFPVQSSSSKAMGNAATIGDNSLSPLVGGDTIVLPSSTGIATASYSQIDTNATPQVYTNGEEVNGKIASPNTTLLPSGSHATETSPSHDPPYDMFLDLPPQDDVVLENSNRPLKAQQKGKAKVRYVDSMEDEDLGTPAPSPPVESPKTTTEPCASLAVAITPEAMKSPTPSEFSWGDTVLRDRMLVRVNYTDSESLMQFDDNINRSTRDLEYEDWGEFLVVWRRTSIEVYKDYTTPGREWAAGHKQLAYVIPLRSSRTRLSLYSFVDLTFCITCGRTTSTLNENATRWIFTRSTAGTQIFVFKLKSRSRAYDWYWQLWRHLGGRIPTSIDVHNPRLNTKVTIDIPEGTATNSSTLYNIFRRENVIQLCVDSLRKVPDYEYLMERALERGRSVQLAWHCQSNIDWIWLERDVFGKPREWSVLCGLAFKQATRQPTLEIRLGEHASNHVYLKDGRKVEEPPAIEGYLDQIRPNRQTKQIVYLSTHSGYLFFLNPARPFPPTPPGFAPTMNPDSSLKNVEIRRGINQIANATSMMDLRSIVAVRRAFQPIPTHVHNVKVDRDDDNSWFEVFARREERSSEDDVDEGGVAALAKAYDSTQLKIRRSFELLLNTGHVMRFEAYSCKVAIEWIERLRVLTFYWKRRHRVDAQQEIELAQTQRPRLTPLTRVCHDDEEAAPEAAANMVSANIDTFYNWCVLEGCKPIVKGGTIYTRKGLRSQYKLVQLFLIGGHLMTFRIGGQSSLYPSMKKKVNLLEAYVCSGYFAAQTLPRGQYHPNAPSAPRRYGDGLETDDKEEDMMFMICYRSHPPMLNADQDPTTTPVADGEISQLSQKFKVLLFKARSVLERDAWCWAINSEIEKILRVQGPRETKLRDAGNLIRLAQ